MTIKAIIVDDEPLALQGLRNHLAKISYIELVDSCEDAIDAIKVLNKKQIDLIFLDIQMPGITGIEFLKTMTNPPIVIITTAFPEYALEGFELSVFDYLVKPITFDRFLKASNKARDYYELLTAGNNPSNASFFFIKCGKQIEKINYTEILFIEAAQNYTIIHTELKKYITYLTFKSIEKFLPEGDFLRVQKSFIISVSKINSIDGDEIKIGTQIIPISPKSKDEILNQILKHKYLKR